jgi:hypothetical protein
VIPQGNSQSSICYTGRAIAIMSLDLSERHLLDALKAIKGGQVLLDKTNLKNKVHWKLQQVEDMQAQVKVELDQYLPSEGEAKVRFLTSQIILLENEECKLIQLKRFFYIISLLVHCARHGGMQARQANGAITVAEALLHTAGVRPGHSRMGFLYGYLYSLQSQFLCQSGHPLTAAWYQQLAKFSSRRAATHEDTYQLLALGKRHLRLGNGSLAHTYFLRVEATYLQTSHYEQARLGRIFYYRLTNGYDLALGLIEESLTKAYYSSEFKIDLHWQKTCIELIKSEGDFSLIMGSLKFEKSYAVDLTYWAKMVKTKIGLLKTSRLPKKFRLIPGKGNGIFVRAAKLLEEAYDVSIPLARRMEKIRDLILRSGEALTIEQELMILCAAARCLARFSAYDFAALALRRYYNLSLALSDGQCGDALGIASDLIGRDWFLGESPCLQTAR